MHAILHGYCSPVQTKSILNRTSCGTSDCIMNNKTFMYYIFLGNAAVTLQFEGETDHLVTTTSAVLVQNELFVMAGRLIGHSIINGGLSLSGLHLVVVHALTGGSKS